MNPSEKAFQKYKEYEANILEINKQIEVLEYKRKHLQREIKKENLINLINLEKVRDK